MATPDSKALRLEAMRASLGRSPRTSTDPAAGHEAILALWARVIPCLSPVIGMGGVDILVKRVLQITNPACPSGALDEGVTPLARIKGRLDACDPGAAEEDGLALLVAFTDLLAALLGDSLTTRLLKPAWEPPSSAPEQEASHGL